MTERLPRNTCDTHLHIFGDAAAYPAANRNALYAPPPAPGGAAHLLFRSENTFMAQPFDAKGLKTTGEMFPIAEQVPISENT